MPNKRPCLWLLKLYLLLGRPALWCERCEDVVEWP